jgi:hypothetical protein
MVDGLPRAGPITLGTDNGSDAGREGGFQEPTIVRAGGLPVASTSRPGEAPKKDNGRMPIDVG